MTDMHIRAMAAWAARRRETEEAARPLAEERAAALAALIARVLDIPPEAVQPLPSLYAAVAVVEGLRFVAGPAGTIALLGRCPHCGRTVGSAPIGDLAELGTQLVAFTPGSTHDCLPELLRDLVQALAATLRQSRAPFDEEDLADDELPF
jgi:hypothetical protein